MCSAHVPEGREPAQRGLCKSCWGSCQDLNLLPESNSDVAADLGECLKEGVTEGVDAEGVDPADTLDLYQVALDAGHHCPDVAEGDEGKEEAPDDGQGDAQDGREQPVAPVLADGEGGVAGFPDTIEAVRSHGLSYHILKIHLGGEQMDIREVWGSAKAPMQGGGAAQGESRSQTEGARESGTVLGWIPGSLHSQQRQAPAEMGDPQGSQHCPATACGQHSGGLNPRLRLQHRGVTVPVPSPDLGNQG